MKHFLHSGFVRLAFVVVMVYVIASSLGLREHVSILSGVSESQPSHTTLGLIYLLSYAAFVVLTPVFVLAAFLHQLLSEAWTNHRQSVTMSNNTESKLFDDTL